LGVNFQKAIHVLLFVSELRGEWVKFKKKVKIGIFDY